MPSRRTRRPLVFGGADCLEPENRRCFVACPAADRTRVEGREFDCRPKQWIKDGFRLREAKTSTAWIDENAMLVGTDFGPGSMTTSGYARSVRLWNRGTPIESARMVLEIPATDMGLFAFSYDAGGRKYVRISHQKDFYSRRSTLSKGGKLVKIDVPGDAEHVSRPQPDRRLRAHAVAGGRPDVEHGLARRDAGGRLSCRPAGVSSSSRTRRARKHQRRGLDERTWLIVSVLNNVKGELRRYRFENDA